MRHSDNPLKLSEHAESSSLDVGQLGHIGVALARAATNARHPTEELAHLQAPIETKIGTEIDQAHGIWTTIDDCRCYARAFTGQATLSRTPIVLVHGFGMSSTYFIRVAQLLAPYFDVYAPDLPGHGNSDTPAQALDIQGLAESLLKWLAAMQLAHVCVVGNSMGCQIAVELAARHPDRVSRLVLIGPTLDNTARSLRRLLPKYLLGGIYEDPSLNSILAKDYWRMAGRLRNELRAMMLHHIEDKLPQLTMPVLFVRGEHDPIAPQRWLNELARITADSRVAVIPAAGHAAQYSAAAEFIPVLMRFLRQHAADRLYLQSGLS